VSPVTRLPFTTPPFARIPGAPAGIQKMQRHGLDPARALGLRNGDAHDLLVIPRATEGHRRHV
jgi:hypothetical protein